MPPKTAKIPSVTIGPISPINKDWKDWKNLLKALKLEALLSAPVKWLQNYDEALKQAAEMTGSAGSADLGAHVVMAYFAGSDWCSHCIDLDNEVFQSKTFRQWFNFGRMVPLLLDFPNSKSQSAEIKTQNAQLYTQYAIGGFPSVLAIRATAVCLSTGTCVVNASEIARVVGYSKGSGPDAWIKSFSDATGIQ